MTDYAELHAHSAFSFLDGCSQPADLAYQAAKLGLSAMAITDHDGLYGVVQFAEAAREVGLPTVFGAELTLDGGPEEPGVSDPPGTHLLALARGPEGYKRLSRAIALAYLAVGEKGPPRYDLDALAAASGGEWLILTGCRKGAVRRALADRSAFSGRAANSADAVRAAVGNPAGGTAREVTGGATGETVGNAAGAVRAVAGDAGWGMVGGGARAMTGDAAWGMAGNGARAVAGDGSRAMVGGGACGTGPAADRLAAARRELDRLIHLFGRDNVAVEITDSDSPGDPAMIAALTELATGARLPLVATGNVHYAKTSQFPMASAMAAIRGRRSLEEMDGYLPAGPTAALRSPGQMLARLSRHGPEAAAAAATAAKLAAECAFDLKLIAPKLPPAYVPKGHDEDSWLEELTWRGAEQRYGPRGPANAKAYQTLAHELGVIKELGFPGYFLIMREIVEFCEEQGILCQGRGSAANSAVCYALGITAVDAVRHGLLFERFLAPEREGYPDIDLDIESGRREEVIQHVYAHYGRERAALVGAVITYRPKLALRDAARALGHGTGQQDAWSKQVERWGHLHKGKVRYVPWGRGGAGPVDADDDLSAIPADVLGLAESFMHLPRHLGIHPGGMVLADQPVIDICPVQWGRMEDRSVLQWDKDDAANAGLVKFDLLGLGMLGAVRLAFEEIERAEGERWQMHTIPPECPEVYDLLCAADTVGVFQVESRAQIATLPRLRPQCFYDIVVEVALIRPGPIQGGSVHPYIERRRGRQPVVYDHELVRPALERTLGVPLFQEQLMQMAIAAAGFSAGQADQLRRAMGSKRSTERMEALKEALMAGMRERGVPAAARSRIYDQLRAFADFGFPESHSFSFALIVYVSAWLKVFHPAAFYAAILASQPMGFYSPQSLVADARRHGLDVRGPDVQRSGAQARVERTGPGDRPYSKLLRGDPELGIRLGLAAVRGIGAKKAEAVQAERERGGAFRSLTDLAHRCGLTPRQMESLATAGALGDLEPDRRRALWAAGATGAAGELPGTTPGLEAPTLPGMSDEELAMADMWATGVTLAEYPTVHVRDQLTAAEVVPNDQVASHPNGEWIKVAGVVTHRQRPGTAAGVTFLNLEDETGQVNIICTADVWNRFRKVGRTASAMVVAGRLENHDGTVGIKAGHLHPLYLKVPTKSRDFH